MSAATTFAAEDETTAPAIEVEEDDYWVQVPIALLYDASITPTAKVIYGVLRHHGMTPQRCFPGQATIAESIGMQARSAYRPLKELEDAGWIARFKRFNKRGERTSDGYRIRRAAVKPAGHGARGRQRPSVTNARLSDKPTNARLSDDAGSPTRDPVCDQRAKSRGEQDQEEQDQVRENNARGDGDPNGQSETAVASDRARAASSRGSSPARRRRSSSNARADEDPNALPGIATSPADAGATPPDSAAPPPVDELDQMLAAEAKPLHPGVPAVVRALGRGVAKHGGKAVKTGSWEKPVDLLLRRGPTEWVEPEPIPVDEVLAVIEWLFDGGTIKRGTFCWADQVQSGAALRKYWIRLRTEADGARRLTPVAGGGRPGRQSMEERLEMTRRVLAEEQAKTGAVDGRVLDVGEASYDRPRRAV